MERGCNFFFYCITLGQLNFRIDLSITNTSRYSVTEEPETPFSSDWPGMLSYTWICLRFVVRLLFFLVNWDIYIHFD